MQPFFAVMEIWSEIAGHADDKSDNRQFQNGKYFSV